jgi:anti-sigma factor RsiW
MTCKECQSLMQGYIDGELDLVTALSLEDHIQNCPKCEEMYRDYLTLRTGLSDKSLYFESPSGLRQRIRSHVRKEIHVPVYRRITSRGWLEVVGGLAIVALLLWMLVGGMSAPSVANHLIDDLVGSHVRSLMVSHLTDVTSSNLHVLKPWFSGKIDFSPLIRDASDHGFPLVGARLDYVAGNPVAAVVYRRGQHVINLFMWRSASDNKIPDTVVTRQGYNLVHWTQGSMTFWLVSDLNRKELEDFGRILQQPLTNPPSSLESP